MRTVCRICLLLLMVVCTACTFEIVDPTAQPDVGAAATTTTDESVQPSTGAYTMSDPYPTTLDGFLQGRNLIVIARIGDVEYSKFYGFDLETGKPIVPTEEDILWSDPTTMADFTLEVEEVLWADADYRPDEPVVMKAIWSSDLSPEGLKKWAGYFIETGLKAPEKGDRYLFILTRNLDGTYSVPYDEHRLIVGEDGILYYSQMSPPYPVKFGEFREGERYGEAKGPPLTVDDLVRAAEARAGEPGVSRSDLNDAHHTIYLPLIPAQ